MKKTCKLRPMLTEAGKNLSEIPWNSYPRPQMRRLEWLCLNGEWEFEATSEITDEVAEITYSERIRVPFCPESLLSGIGRTFPKGMVFHYRRHFHIPEDWEGRRVLLHFGAVDQECSVRVDGTNVIRHCGGYLPFDADITEALCTEEKHTLELEVVDDLSHMQPWGKQSRRRGGMWYTPFSGIWQTVWLEPVPENHITGLEIQADARGVNITVCGGEQATVVFQGIPQNTVNRRVRIEPDQPRLWSPEDPHLYSFSVVTGNDIVESYFALRDLSTKVMEGIPRLCLNGKPYFFNGLLDQGYWSDGICTPAAPSCYDEDIFTVKKLGFNTLRKHIKIEPEQFYYACDRLGIAVFQDMVNNGEYHYLRDTVLPTLGFLQRRDSNLNSDTENRGVFLKHMEQTVRHLQNHPCIVYWTIFNEGWGQFRADEAYDRLRELDDTRWIDSTSGWFHQTKSDVDSLHIYFTELHPGTERLPQVLSEFGGFSYKIPEHSANLEKTYGYRKYTDRESFVHDLRELYKELILQARAGLCASVYTQVSDVEDETNGLVTYDRSVCKLEPEELNDLAAKLQEAVQSKEQQAERGTPGDDASDLLKLQ